MTAQARTSGGRTGSALALACLSVVAVAACTGGDDPGTTPVQDTPTTDLTITLQSIPGMGSEPVVHTLTCDPVGGDLDGADAACAALADAEPDPFAPVPETEQCLQVMKGPGEITVVGAWDGVDLDAVFTRHNSCESDRFERLVSMLGIEIGT